MSYDNGDNDEPVESYGIALATEFVSGMTEPLPKFQLTPEMLRAMRGGSQYMDVKWRILWFRSENPRGKLISELVDIGPDRAVFRCTATKDDGGEATGHGSETKGDFGDFIEKAETKARGRALEALGYGTAAALNDDGALADAPVETTHAQPRHGAAPPTQGNRVPPAQNASPRPNAGPESASQRVPGEPPAAPSLDGVLSATVLPENQRATPAQIGSLTNLMRDNGEDALTVPFQFIPRRVVSDTITRLKNGGKSGLDVLWRVIATDATIDRSKAVADDVLMTYVSAADQLARFNTLVSERESAYLNAWQFLLWVTKIASLSETTPPELSMHRLVRLMQHAPTEKLAEKIHAIADEVGKEFQTEEYRAAMTATFQRISQES